MKNKINLYLIICLFFLPIATAVIIDSIDDYPDPIFQGEDLTFDVYWSITNLTHNFTDDFNYGISDNPENHGWTSCIGNCYTYNDPSRGWIFAFEKTNYPDTEKLYKSINPTQITNLEIEFDMEARAENSSYIIAQITNSSDDSVITFWLGNNLAGTDFGYQASNDTLMKCGTYNINEENKYTIKNFDLSGNSADLYQNDDFKCQIEFYAPNSLLSDLKVVKIFADDVSSGNVVYYFDDVTIQWIEKETITEIDMDICGTQNFNEETGTCTVETLCSSDDQSSPANCLYDTTGVDPNIYNYYGYACYFFEQNITEINLTEPEILWEKTFGGTGSEAGNSIVQTSDGGLALFGHTTSFGAGSSDFWLVKTDSSGNHVWNKTYGGSSTEWSGFEKGTVIETSDNGLVMIGETWTYDVGGGDIWLVKIDSSGSVVWGRTFGGSNVELGQDVIQTSDGGYALAGTTLSLTGDALPLLLKTDSSGFQQWNRTFEETVWEGGIYSLIQLSDNSYVMTGEMRTLKTSPTSGQFVDALLVIKTDSSGNTIWNKTYGEYSFGNFHIGYDIVQTYDNNFVIVGQYEDAINPEELWILKIDSNGNHLWNQTYEGVYDNKGYSVIETSNKNLLITGKYGVSAYDEDLWIISTDENGNKIWDKQRGVTGFNEDDQGNDIIQVSDGILVIGTSALNGDDMWLIKLGEEAPSENFTGQNICSDPKQGQFTVYDNETIPTCGNGIFNKELNEECEFDEEGNTIWTENRDYRDCRYFDECTSGTLTCNPSTCKVDLSGCEGCLANVGYCGDEIIQVPNGDSFYEKCDGTNLDKKNCRWFGNYKAGSLSCFDDCTYNMTGCYTPSECVLDPLSCCICGDEICTKTSPCFENFDNCEQDCGTADEVSCAGSGSMCIPSHLVDITNLANPDEMTKGLLPVIYRSTIGFLGSSGLYFAVFILIVGIVCALIISLLTAFIYKLLTGKYK